MTRKQLWLAIFVLLVAALVAATARWIVWPKTDAAPEHADAVVVLGGGGSERLDEGLKLVDEGVAQVLVISDGNRPGWEKANELCAKGDPGFAVVCFEPKPHRTQGEAEGVAELARERRLAADRRRHVRLPRGPRRMALRPLLRLRRPGGRRGERASETDDGPARVGRVRPRGLVRKGLLTQG